MTLPIAWLLLTALRPERDIFYILSSRSFTLENFQRALEARGVIQSMINSAVVATISTGAAIVVTTPSGYVLSRFRGPVSRGWFVAIYIFRTIPYISFGLPLYLAVRRLGLYDTFSGIMLPYIAIHVCFFSWMMKGFFDAVDPDLESAALIDGCTRWGAFVRVAVPQIVRGMAALGILSWLWTWNEFLFALLLTGHGTPLVTVRLGQFVHEFGIQWNLMSATAVLAMIPGLIVTVMARRYVVEGLTLR